MFKLTCGTIGAIGVISYTQYLENKYHKKELKPCNLVDEFSKLSLSKEDKKFVREATIYQIKYPLPGRGFRKWERTSNATFYKKNNELKVYCRCENYD